MAYRKGVDLFTDTGMSLALSPWMRVVVVQNGAFAKLSFALS